MKAVERPARYTWRRFWAVAFLSAAGCGAFVLGAIWLVATGHPMFAIGVLLPASAMPNVALAALKKHQRYFDWLMERAALAENDREFEYWEKELRK